jgi:hypothetical protein
MLLANSHSYIFLPHPYSIPWRPRGIVVHPLLDVWQELPIECNNNAFLSILAGGGAYIAIEIDGAHYTFGFEMNETKLSSCHVRTDEGKKQTHASQLGRTNRRRTVH